MNTELDVSYGSIDGAKIKLVMDLKGVIADVGDLLNDVNRSTAEEFSAGRQKINVRLGKESSRLGNARIAVVEKANGATEVIQEYLKENPAKVIGVVVAGIVITFVLSHA